MIAIALFACSAVQEEAPVKRIADLSASVMSTLGDDALSARQKRDQFKTALKESVDWTIVPKLVLARNWKGFSEDQRARFVEVFQQHLVHTYWSNTDSFSLRAIDVQRGREESNGDWSVVTQFKLEGSSSAVAYRMRKDGAGNWMIIDVLVEGVSLVANFRSQFNSLLSSEGPDDVIKRLAEKNAEAEERFAAREGEEGLGSRVSCLVSCPWCPVPGVWCLVPCAWCRQVSRKD